MREVRIGNYYYPVRAMLLAASIGVGAAFAVFFL